jgi:hypothetical protein
MYFYGVNQILDSRVSAVIASIVIDTCGRGE